MLPRCWRTVRGNARETWRKSSRDVEDLVEDRGCSDGWLTSLESTQPKYICEICQLVIQAWTSAASSGWSSERWKSSHYWAAGHALQKTCEEKILPCRRWNSNLLVTRLIGITMESFIDIQQWHHKTSHWLFSKKKKILRTNVRQCLPPFTAIPSASVQLG